MRTLTRWLLAAALLTALGAGAGWHLAGREAGPDIDLRAPESIIGQRGALEFRVTTPGGRLTRLTAAVEQQGATTEVFNLDTAAGGDTDIRQDSAESLYIMRDIGKASVPALVAGRATIRITAARSVFFGLREAATTVTRDVDVRLEPPRVAVLSTHHYVNHGGAEFVVFRATPPDVTGAVLVGDREFPAFPGSGAGLTDPAIRVAFFALAHDEDLQAPVAVVARDAAGNEARAAVDHRAFARTFARSRIVVDDRFIGRVVPAIAAANPSLGIDTASREGLLAGFLTVNGDLRRRNNDTIAALAARTHPEMLWADAFAQLGNTAVQSRFADDRTYVHDGRDIDRQVHLGFDLASTAQAPVAAANRGVVIWAKDLGIYGNTVVLDHGLGVQSLYSHLSTIGVEEGATVEKGGVLGRTGLTGLAGGDHLHFTMLVGGVAVNPVEWWDPTWMEDRVLRKIREAGGTPPAVR
ncbi:MAG: M23 family metallopeptidase [Acidobacteriota bacterium]